MSLLGISKKGKWIIGGVCAFAVVATATTGLAAWVIGQNAPVPTDGTVNVEEVNDKSVALTVNKDTSDLSVVFGPKGSGTIVTGDNGNEEDMSFDIKGTYALAAHAPTDFSFKIDVKLTLKEKMQALVKEKYIVAPGTATGTAGEYSLGELTITESDTSFSGGAYSFKWGDAFKPVGAQDGVNPCQFFDGTEGKGYDEALVALNKLREANKETFTVTLTVNTSAAT